MGNYQKPWHRWPKDEAPGKLAEACRRAIQDNQDRYGQAIKYASVFEGSLLTSFLPVGYALETTNIFPGLRNKLIRRKCRSVVKGAHALLWGNDDPLPQFRSVGGDWSTQTQAILLNRAIDAEYEQPQGRFDNEHDLWRHAGLIAMGSVGSVAVFELPGWGQTEARINDTLTMSLETSGPHGRVLGCVATDYYEPEELSLRFPQQREAIEKNATTMWQLGEQRPGRHGRQRMEERWVTEIHMGYRCAIRGEDGRKLWTLKDGTRLGKDEVYEYDELPCTIYHFERQVAGDWGMPLTAYIYELCIRHNEVTHDVDQKQINSPQRVAHGSAETIKKIGGKMKGTVVIPSEMAASDLRISEVNTVDEGGLKLAETYARWIDEDAMVGAEHQGGGGKMASSGKHEKFRASYFTEAFAPEARRIIHARTIATGRRKVRALQMMVKEGQDITRRWEKGSLSSVIDLADLDLDADKFMLRVSSVSEEKNSVATLLEFGQSMVEQEKASLGEYMQFRQHLDADSIGDQVSEEQNWINRQVEKWLHAKDSERLEDGFYQSPRKAIDLDRWADYVNSKLMHAESMGAPPDRLEYFELFLEELAVLIEQEKAQTNTSISATADAGQIFPSLGAGGSSGQPTGQGLPGGPAGGNGLAGLGAGGLGTGAALGGLPS